MEEYKFKQYVQAREFSIKLAKEIANRIRKILQQHNAIECLPLAFGLLVYSYEILIREGFEEYEVVEVIRRFINALQRYNIKHFPSKTELIEYDF